MEKSFHDHIEDNKKSTMFLFGAFIVLILALGWVFGWYMGDEITGTSIAIMFAIVWGIISYYAGDKVILSISGAKHVEKKDYPYLYNVTEGLAIAAGVPMPKVYVIDDPAPNAFATGRDPEHSSIAVTTGLLKLMNRQELEGVVAHELSHIKNYDIRTMMIAAVFVGIIALLADLFLRIALRSKGGRGKGAGAAKVAFLLLGIVFVALTPIAAQMIKRAISRSREYLADSTAVQLTRYPPGLANALQKLADDKQVIKNANGATAHLYIESPTDKESGFFKSIGEMFSTHPPIQERIKRLREM